MSAESPALATQGAGTYPTLAICECPLRARPEADACSATPNVRIKSEIVSLGFRLNEFLITNGRTSFAPCPARTLAYHASSGRHRSGAAKLGWIVVGGRVVVVGPQTTRSGVVAIDPRTTRSDVARDHSMAGTNDDMPRFGKIPSCGGVRRSTESDQTAQCQDRAHCIFSS